MMVLITEFMDETALEAFGDDIQVIFDPGLVDNRPGLLGGIGDAAGVIVRNRTRVDAELLEAAPKLKVVGRLGVGLDNIDLDQCEARGIKVCPATGANTRSVAEYVIAAAMMLARGAFQSTADIQSGEWPRAKLGSGHEAAGQRLGLIGFGAIAREVADLARGLGIEICAHDPHLPESEPAWAQVERVTLDAVLATADIISLHVPLTDETVGLIDAEKMALMKPGVIIINTARGEIIDVPALIAALRSGQIGGAALDVFAEEPPSAEMARAFTGLPNLLLTPHIAGVTSQANARVSQLTVENVLHVLKGV
ncbi:MAG: hydroxyacid dehydrogenase [Pseudomonadota bacterium]